MHCGTRESQRPPIPDEWPAKPPPRAVPKLEDVGLLRVHRRHEQATLFPARHRSTRIQFARRIARESIFVSRANRDMQTDGKGIPSQRRCAGKFVDVRCLHLAMHQISPEAVRQVPSFNSWPRRNGPGKFSPRPSVSRPRGLQSASRFRLAGMSLGPVQQAH
ncbi:MAG: hypothetical protein QOC81_644 [Thermoanaerobaculia bacterium]|nr:hypothetical protein [Thermoanaerobaculia bacterium]